MRKLALGKPPSSPPPLNLSSSSRLEALEKKVEWLINSINEIQIASYEEIVGELADAYTVTNIPDPPDRALSGTETTAADIAAVLATLISDLKARAFRP